jgi:hypothetical protein
VGDNVFENQNREELFKCNRNNIIDYRFLSETRICFSGIEYSFLGRNREEYCKIRQERIFIKPNREVLIEL